MDKPGFIVYWQLAGNVLEQLRMLYFQPAGYAFKRELWFLLVFSLANTYLFIRPEFRVFRMIKYQISGVSL